MEIAGLIPQDDCCAKSQTASVPKGENCDSGCTLVEKAGYKAQDNHKIAVPVLAFAVLFLQSISSEHASVAPAESISSWPPDNLQLPQFVLRTALPVRAPSFAS